MSIKDRIGNLFRGGSKAKEVRKDGTTIEDRKPEAVVPASPAAENRKPEAATPAGTAADPIVPEIEVKPVTSEVATIPGQDKGRSPGEKPKPEDEHVDTIPLGEDEEKSLFRNKYEQNKAKFSRRFLMEKDFWMHSSSMDPQKPNQIIKVKRVVELRASSFFHALKLIGWDKANTRLVKETDDYGGEVGILVDNKLVCTYQLPPLPEGQTFESMTGGKRREYVRLAKESAVANPKVQETLAKDRKVVTGWAFEPRSHIRLTTSRIPKVKVPAKGAVAITPCPLPMPQSTSEAVKNEEDKLITAAIEGAAQQSLDRAVELGVDVQASLTVQEAAEAKV